MVHVDLSQGMDADAPGSPCRSCGERLERSVVDLGLQPLANAFLAREQLDSPEPRFPLHAYVCEHCWLVQLSGAVDRETLFSDYAYFSSYSQTWLEHARTYAETMIERLSLGADSLVVEVASNDGYLLRYFTASSVPVLGIEPAENVAQHARSIGVPTEALFLGYDTGRALRDRGLAADLLIGNNVLAHVPDLNDFIAGLDVLLAPRGTLTLEFPHVLQLLEKRQFDTIYHEHYSYFSLIAAESAFARHGLVLAKVEEIPTHGGSLRVHLRHVAVADPPDSSVSEMLGRERAAGLTDAASYERLGGGADEVRRELRRFLQAARADGKKVVGYGAPAKGNTLLNFCGVSTDLLEYTVDLSPHKQGMFLPGSHLPVESPERLLADRPDYVLILPWNLQDEIVEQMAAVHAWGGRFVVPIPTVQTI